MMAGLILTMGLTFIQVKARSEDWEDVGFRVENVGAERYN
jgi:hypothetical protein